MLRWKELRHCSLEENGQKCFAMSLCTVFLHSPALIWHLQGELLWFVKALYYGKDVFMWLPARIKNSICYQILPFVSDHKFGPIRSAKSIRVYQCSCYFSDDFSNRWSRPEIARSNLRWWHLIQHYELYHWLKSYRKPIQVSSLLFWAPTSLMKSRWRKALKNLLVSVRHWLYRLLPGDITIIFNAICNMFCNLPGRVIIKGIVEVSPISWAASWMDLGDSVVNWYSQFVFYLRTHFM